MATTKLLAPAAIFLALASSSTAKTHDDLERQGYLFVAPGAFLSEGVATLELGGGMEWLVYEGLAVGFDASLMAFPECFRCDGMLLGSIDVAYHFIPRSRRLVPFVLGGAGGASLSEGSVGLMSVGGGVNYWFGNGMAIRLELRDRFDSDGIHNLGFRVGVTF